MEGERKLSAEAVAIFREGIGLVLSRWSALQLAVENEWGGRGSRQNAEQLAADAFSWFTQSAEILYIDDLEDILNEAMISLNTMTEDGSIEEDYNGSFENPKYKQFQLTLGVSEKDKSLMNITTAQISGSTLDLDFG